MAKAKKWSPAALGASSQSRNPWMVFRATQGLPEGCDESLNLLHRPRPGISPFELRVVDWTTGKREKWSLIDE
jgi:hypothetical protein